MKKLNGTVIVTYRCNARCTMCNRHRQPSRPEEELTVETIRKLPKMYFTNITGGEPFLREDLPEIVRELEKKSDRIVISTNGYFTHRILALCREFPKVGIRVSMEGLERTNDAIRGLPQGFRRGWETLRQLKALGVRDIGIGVTLQDRNAEDLMALYAMAEELGLEFATASLHNSFYFVQKNNRIQDRPKVAGALAQLIRALLKSRDPKKWFRAYFNHGLIHYIYGGERLLPCRMGSDCFFIDPYGDVMPCNGSREKCVMGNLNTQSWRELWHSPQAQQTRQQVRNCKRNCWMIGSVSPAMRRQVWKPGLWVLVHKLRGYDLYEEPLARAYRDGRVTKEELDARSTWEGAAGDGGGSGVQDGGVSGCVPAQSGGTELEKSGNPAGGGRLPGSVPGDL